MSIQTIKNGGDDEKTNDQQQCAKGIKCVHVRNGNCRFRHPVCKDGANCKKVKQKNCAFFHPKSHFSTVEYVQIPSESNYK